MNILRNGRPPDDDQAGEQGPGRCVEPDARARLARLLTAAIGGGVRVVLTVRSEYLDDLSELLPLPDDSIDTYLLGPLASQMLRLANEEPARIAGLRLAPELSARLMTDTESGDALPLLAFTLQQLADGLSRGDALWDVSDPARPFQLGTPLTGPKDTVDGLAFSPNDRLLAGVDESGGVSLWNLSALKDVRDHLVADACARALRGFTPDEWTRYVGTTQPYRQTCAH